MDTYRQRMFVIVFGGLLVMLLLFELTAYTSSAIFVQVFGALLAALALAVGGYLAYRWLWPSQAASQPNRSAARLVTLLICALCVAQGLALALR